MNNQNTKQEFLKAYTFKFLPRYANQAEKKENLVNFIQTMEVETRNDRPTNYQDFYLLGNINDCCTEIIRNKELLADRNIKATVHTIVSSSKSSKEMAFIAENIDGVMEALREQTMKYGIEGDFTAQAETAKIWEKTSKEIETLAEKLKVIIDKNLEQGYGNRNQLKRAEYNKFNEKKDEIATLLENDSSIQEVSEKFAVKAGLVEKLSSDLINKKLYDNRALIKEKLNANESRLSISEELNISKGRLNKFITSESLAPVPAKKIKKQTEAKKPAATKVVASTKKSTKEKKTA